MRKIELLSESHDRDGFDCGNDPLNLFLKQTARQHAVRGISRTFVLVDEDAVEPIPIIGFFSLNLCQIKSEALPPAEGKKLPRDASGVRLGRLARAKEYRGQGIGETLLVAAMHKFMEIFQRGGGIGLFVDAKDENAKKFYQRFEFIPMPSNELQLFLPTRTIQQAVATK